MLGARARAAEYNAFKAASARQASRDAEEHKKPPKPAPISLGAFTKNAPASRNKGTKAWVPLVLEDSPEAGLKTGDESEARPFPSITHDAAGDGDNPGPGNFQPTGMGVSTVATPTRSLPMSKTSERAPTLFTPTPQRPQPHSLVRHAQHGFVPSTHSSPSNFTAPGGFPYPNVIWPSSMRGVPFADQLPFPTFEPCPPFSAMMVPSDISPTKQENKLAMLSRDYADLALSFPGSHQQSSYTLGTYGTPRLYSPTMVEYQFENQGWPTFVPAGAPSTVRRPTMHHALSDNMMLADGDISDASSMYVDNIARSTSYADPPRFALEEQSVSTPAGRFTAGPGLHGPLALASEEEPYDRQSKRQNFVAAQHALAKTGKTVLHNPHLHRVKAEDLPAAASGTAQSVAAGQIASTPRKNHITSPRLRTRGKQQPGFGMSVAGRPSSEEDEGEDKSTAKDRALQKEFGVGTAEWFELTPVTMTQRKKMSRATRSCARTQSPDPAQTTLQDIHEARQDYLRQQMDLDKKDSQGVRKMVDQIAQDYLSKRLLPGQGGEGTFEDQHAIAKQESAAVWAVGTILANLTEPIDSVGPDINTGNALCSYKPAPEYAVERGRLLVGGSSNTSFFEQETGGFYSAPSRIARDPRFRPASKETVKSKMEDEWRLRQDMYGRRRI